MTKFLPPHSLSAKTKDGLRKLMIRTNNKFGRQFDYFDFSYAQEQWHCWFKISEKDIRDAVLAEKSNG